jgi:hypothetical protein
MSELVMFAIKEHMFGVSKEKNDTINQTINKEKPEYFNKSLFLM